MSSGVRHAPKAPSVPGVSSAPLADAMDDARDGNWDNRTSGAVFPSSGADAEWESCEHTGIAAYQRCPFRGSHPYCGECPYQR